MKTYRTNQQNIIKRLTKANIMERHAEAIANELLNNEGSISRDYLEVKFVEITAITEAKIECMRADLLKWFVGIISIQTISIIISIFLSK